MLAPQYLDRRIPDRETRERVVAAWEEEPNALGGKVDWCFTIQEAHHVEAPVPVDRRVTDHECPDLTHKRKVTVPEGRSGIGPLLDAGCG